MSLWLFTIHGYSIFNWTRASNPPDIIHCLCRYDITSSCLNHSYQTTARLSWTKFMNSVDSEDVYMSTRWIVWFSNCMSTMKFQGSVAEPNHCQKMGEKVCKLKGTWFPKDNILWRMQMQFFEDSMNGVSRRNASRRILLEEPLDRKPDECFGDIPNMVLNKWH